MTEVPCTYASQPEENRRRAVREILDLFPKESLAQLSISKVEACLETIWNADLKIGNIICSLQSPVPMRLSCPSCGALHVDEGEFATKPHSSHACQSCGMVWRPALVDTVGVKFLPGFKNDES